MTDKEPCQPWVGRTASILAKLPAVLAVSRADLASLHGDPRAPGSPPEQRPAA